MTPQEVIELIEKEKEIIRENMEHNKKLFESGETNINLYIKDLMHTIERSSSYIDDGECEWKVCDDNFGTAWYGSCGMSWQMMNDDGLTENEMFYCPKCGKKIKETKCDQTN
jgi:hypothetical protein